MQNHHPIQSVSSIHVQSRKCRERKSLDDGTGVRGDTGPEIGTLLGDAGMLAEVQCNHAWQHVAAGDLRSVDGRSLHLSLGVDDNTGVVLKVEEDTIPSPPRLPLSTDNSGHNLLPQLGLSLLDGSHDHVSSSGGRKSRKSSTETDDGDNVEVC
jgi:hypothetical protein